MEKNNSQEKKTKRKQPTNFRGSIIKTKGGKQSNFKEEFVKFIESQYPNRKISPEEILAYIYVVLYSNKYRDKYKEFLKFDFQKFLL